MASESDFARSLQEAVLSLCKRNYAPSVNLEIDAIICLSESSSAECMKVVKIHETLHHNGSENYDSNQEVSGENMGLRCNRFCVTKDKEEFASMLTMGHSAGEQTTTKIVSENMDNNVRNSMGVGVFSVADAEDKGAETNISRERNSGDDRCEKSHALDGNRSDVVHNMPECGAYVVKAEATCTAVPNPTSSLQGHARQSQTHTSTRIQTFAIGDDEEEDCFFVKEEPHVDSYEDLQETRLHNQSDLYEALSSHGYQNHRLESDINKALGQWQRDRFDTSITLNSGQQIGECSSTPLWYASNQMGIDSQRNQYGNLTTCGNSSLIETQGNQTASNKRNYYQNRPLNHSKVLKPCANKPTTSGRTRSIAKGKLLKSTSSATSSQLRKNLKHVTPTMFMSAAGVPRDAAVDNSDVGGTKYFPRILAMYLCGRCGTKFKYKSNRDRHERASCGISKSNLNYPCLFCEKIFKRSDVKKRHMMKVHKREFENSI